MTPLLLALLGLVFLGLLVFWIASENAQQYEKHVKCLKIHTEAYCMGSRIDHGQWLWVRVLVLAAIYSILHLQMILQGSWWAWWALAVHLVTAIFGIWPLFFDLTFNAMAKIPLDHIGTTAWGDRAWRTIFGKGAFWGSRVWYVILTMCYFLV